MPASGHYSGRLKEGIEKANEATRGRDGTFYKLMTESNFYDIDDESNGLTDWQRAGVPEYNKKRISSLSTAISDMITDFLTNDEYGVMVPLLDEIVNKLDQRSSMNKGSIDALGTSMAAIPGGQGGAPASQAMEQMIAASMGGNPFDPDMIPPLSIGFAGLPISIASCFKIGFFTPNWEFLYEHETVKSNGFYAGPDGSVYIGAGIPTTIGGKCNALLLNLIFSVPTVNENGNPEGDMVNGVSLEDFKLIITASKHTMAELEAAKSDLQNELYEVANFTLSDGQMRAAYFKYIQMTLWGTICNDKNWAYLHWGCVTNNAIPEPIKTATCSFIKTNGVALSPTTGTEACLFSYLINTGCAYMTGKNKATGLFLMTGMRYISDTAHNVKTVLESEIETMKTRWSTDNYGVPVDKHLARRHFMLAADLLSRMSYDKHPDADNLRKRRVDEANLIYDYCVGKKIKFGESSLDSEISKSGAKRRGFFDFKGRSFYIHKNDAPPLPQDPDDIEIFDGTQSNTPIGDMTKRVIRYIARQAGLRGVYITSLYRSPEKQGTVMFNNRQNANGGRPVSYAAPGRAVDDRYDEVSKKYYGCVRKIGDDHADEAKKAMIAECKRRADAGTPVSKHGANPEVLQAVDMGPNSMKSRFHYTDEELKRFHIACYDAWKKKYLRAYFGPPEYGDKAKDPAFHIEVYQHPTENGCKEPPEAGGINVDVLPDVGTTLSNANLENEAMFDAIFATDKARS